MCKKSTVIYGDHIGKRMDGWCVFNGKDFSFLPDKQVNSNVTGVLMGNSWGQSPNNTHGSMVGRAINRSNSNEGIGILTLGTRAGYIFAGCQAFFSKIVLEDVNGFVFASMNQGRKVEIDIKGGGTVTFSDSVFRPAPDAIRVTDNDTVRFVNCYTRDIGEPVGLQTKIIAENAEKFSAPLAEERGKLYTDGC